MLIKIKWTIRVTICTDSVTVSGLTSHSLVINFLLCEVVRYKSFILTALSVTTCLILDKYHFKAFWWPLSARLKVALTYPGQNESAWAQACKYLYMSGCN